MQDSSRPIVKICGAVYTAPQGIIELMRFYNEAAQHNNTTISIDLYSLTWIDANLASFLNALIYRLNTENNLQFSTDFNYVESKFDVLFRNGWLQRKEYKLVDKRATTIPCAQFLPSQELKFTEYIEKSLLCHRGIMPHLDHGTRRQIQSNLIEIFQNFGKHARTDYPLFACGQYYPNKKYFIFSMVDLGIGFLKPIQNFTNGEINSHIGAIRWGLSGKSSSITDPSSEIGGFGLQGIHQYCQGNKGIFQIYTGTDFWGTDLENTADRGHIEIGYFQGSLLNLFFNVNS